jgi:hypothetical protein
LFKSYFNLLEDIIKYLNNIFINLWYMLLLYTNLLHILALLEG